jgi:hypothetical protein
MTIIIPQYKNQEIQANPHHPNSGNCRLIVECADDGQVSDGFHTFAELYEHRCLLYLAFLKLLQSPHSFRAKKHQDGYSFEGWFLVGTVLPGEGQISYHLPDSMWDLADFLETIKLAPEWDGHTSQCVVDRLRNILV